MPVTKRIRGKGVMAIQKQETCCEDAPAAGILDGMGRKKSQPEPSESASKTSNTSLIRTEHDLAYKLGVIVSIQGGTVSDLISPVLRPLIEEWYAAALKRAESMKASARRKTPAPKES